MSEFANMLRGWIAFRLYMRLPLPHRVQLWLLPWAGEYANSARFWREQ